MPDTVQIRYSRIILYRLPDDSRVTRLWSFVSFGLCAGTVNSYRWCLVLLAAVQSFVCPVKKNTKLKTTTWQKNLHFFTFLKSFLSLSRRCDVLDRLAMMQMHRNLKTGNLKLHLRFSDANRCAAFTSEINQLLCFTDIGGKAVHLRSPCKIKITPSFTVKVSNLALFIVKTIQG